MMIFYMSTEQLGIALYAQTRQLVQKKFLS